MVTVALGRELKDWAETLGYSLFCSHVLWGSMDHGLYIGQLDHSRPSVLCLPSLRCLSIGKGHFLGEAESCPVPTSSFWGEAKNPWAPRSQVGNIYPWRPDDRGERGPLEAILYSPSGENWSLSNTVMHSTSCSRSLMKNWQLEFHLGFRVSWIVLVMWHWEPMVTSQYGLLFPRVDGVC